MFQNISAQMLDRMKHLEKIDAQDRVDGTENSQRLRQIPPETGKFLSLLAASSPAGSWIEIGTSGGYSALWLSLACHECDQYLTTFELLEEKAHIARKTFEAAGVDQSIRVVVGDARESLNDVANISFCFLDSDKELYPEFYDLVIPKLVSGGIFIADNLISHEEELQSFVDNAENDESVDALVVPIGKGLLVCRKI